MKKYFLLFSVLFVFLTEQLTAQTNIGKISGIITDDKQKPIDGATVTLLKSKDGALVKVSVSDKNGRYEFEKISFGEYIITTTVTGFQKNPGQL